MFKFCVVHRQNFPGTFFFTPITSGYIPCFVTDRLISLTFINRSFFFPYLEIKLKQRKHHKISVNRPKNLSSADFAELQYLSINGP